MADRSRRRHHRGRLRLSWARFGPVQAVGAESGETTWRISRSNSILLLTLNVAEQSGLRTEVNIGSPKQWISGMRVAKSVDSTMECAGRLVSVEYFAPGQSGIDMVGDLNARSVGDAPHGGNDVLVADELHGCGEVDRLVEVVHATGGGLAGGQEG